MFFLPEDFPMNLADLCNCIKAMIKDELSCRLENRHKKGVHVKMFLNNSDGYIAKIRIFETRKVLIQGGLKSREMNKEAMRNILQLLIHAKKTLQSIKSQVHVA